MATIIQYQDLLSTLDSLYDGKESCELEFKSAAGGFPQSFWETYSSFANTQGGIIILGIKEKNGRFILDGISAEQAEKYRHDFFNLMHNKEKVNMPLLRDNDVQIITHDNAYFLCFYIPRAEYGSRPVYCGRDPFTGTYRRDSEGDYHCTREEVQSMYADANLSAPMDGKILANFSKKDLDDNSIQQYRRLFQQANNDHVWNSLSDDEFLEKLNVIRTDRKTGEKGISYAGVLMFGTYSAIMDANPNFFPDYREIQSKEDRWIDRICPDGNWESNLFQFYRKVLPILQGFLPTPFILENNQRKNDPPAHVAIREALTNALVHADYSLNASLTIYKYPSKIVISNPGTMLISLRQFYMGGESVCRNKYLQTMFTFLGSADKAGSGADKIIKGWEQNNWQKPYIEEKTHPNKVVLTMTMESLLDDSIKNGLIAKFGEDILKLPHNQLITIALAYSEEEINNERLQFALDMHPADITKMLTDMCKNNLLTPIGYGRGTKYKLMFSSSATLESSSATLDALSATLDSSSATFNPLSATLEPLKAIFDSSSTTFGPASATLEYSNIDLDSLKTVLDSSKEILEPLNAVVDITAKSKKTKQKRMSKDARQKMIVDYCTDWKSVEDICQYTQLEKAYLRNTILPKIEHLLEKMHDVPHHPKQKYRRRK